MTLKDVAAYIKKFYQDTGNTHTHESTLAESGFKLDHGFLAKVWQWLTREDDILVDDAEQLKSWSFEQLTAQYPGALDGVEFDETSHDGQSGTKDKNPKPHAASSYCPRITVNIHRIHQAICGHDPDPSRVPASEYALLSVIARTREEGILQGVAGRLTGQDKRSVPKRTDCLHSKGYIVKRTVLAGGQKTSRLILKRFARASDGSSDFLVKDLAIRIVSTLQSDRFMTQDDLATILSLTDPARRRVLNQVVAQLVRRKCVKKIKAAFGPDSDAGELKLCLQVVRELEETDWTFQEQDNISFAKSVDDAILKAANDIDAADPDANEIADEAEIDQTDDQIFHHLPQWNPDRLIPNILWDLAANAGEEGITNTSARRHITGYSVRRPLESTLVRISHSSLKRQPVHIKELGIVRSTEVGNAVARYVHRTFDSFKSLVQRNLADWSAIEGGNAFVKAHPDETNETSSTGKERDAFGFPVRRQPAGQISNGLVSIDTVARVQEARSLKPNSREFLLIESANGDVSLSLTAPADLERADDFAPNGSPASKVRSKSSAKARKPPPKKMSKHHPQGRPRKFSRGTEKFWRDMLLVRKLEDDPTFSRRSGLTGLTQDVELLDWYNDRPLQYDDTILLALEQGLPLPCSSEDVSQSWMDQMEAYINRSGPGVFVTPRGATKVLRGRFSCLVTIKSSRIQELDLREKTKVPNVFSLVSSAAHTFRIYHTDASAAAQTSKKAKRVNLNITRKVPEPGSQVITDQSTPQSAAASERSPSATPEVSPPKKLKRKRRSQSNDHDAVQEELVTTPKATRPKRKAAKLKHTVEEPTTPEHRSSPPSQQTPPPIVTGRSTRTRKPTQKVLESNQDVPPTRRRSSAAVRPSPLIMLSQPSEEPRGTDSSLVNKDLTVEESNTHDEEQAVVGSPQTDQLVSQPPDTNALKASESIEPTICDRESASKGDKLRAESVPQSASVTNEANRLVAEVQPREEAKTNGLQEQPERVGGPQPEPPLDGDLGGDLCGTTQPLNVPSVTDETAQDVPESAKFISINAFVAPTLVATDSAVIPSTPERPRSTIPHTPDSDYQAPEHESAEPSASPATEETPILKGRDAVEHYKIILLEIIHMCGGVIPNSPMLWRRAVRAKCFEAGVDDNPSVKLLRSQMNILATRGKVKVMNFAYQRNGMNHNKAIVALPHIQLTDSTFLNMQQKMIALPVEDQYIPPELAAEISRKPSAAAKRDLMAGKAARALNSKPKRQIRQKERPQRETTPPEDLDLLPNEPPSPPPVVSANTGFLTLKVPNIARIQTSNTFTSHYFDINPATTIQFEADANEAATQTALPLPVSQRRSGVRIPRATTYQPGQRKIQWGVPKQPRRLAIPTSLKAILSQKKDDLSELLTGLEPFERDVERVRTWEENNITLLRDPRPEEWHFINYLVPKKDFVNACDPDQVHLFVQIKLLDNTENSDFLAIEETDLPEEGSWGQFREVLAKARSKQKRIDEAATKRKRKLEEFADDHDSDFAGSRADASTRKKSRRKRNTERRISTRKAGTQKTSRHQGRGIGLRHLTKEEAYQVCISFVIVRVLAGGLDKYVDFSLVKRLNPSETETLLEERWRVLSRAYLSDMDAFTQDFQIKYLDALAEDKVPSVNYQDIAQTDWEGILQWALENIDTSEKDVLLEIPPTRDDFLALNKIELIEPTPVRNLYNQSQSYTIAAKESIWSSTITGITNTQSALPEGSNIETRFSAEEFENDVDAARARSWILAAVLTKRQVYDPVKTRAKLRYLAPTETECDKLLAATMKQMQVDKIIVRQDSSDALNESDGSLYSGTHGWKISRKWFDRFDANRNITFTMLRDAARYKLQVLDPAFSQGQHVDLGRTPFLADGCMVAIFNLLDQGLINLKPGADVPASRYGLDWEDQGYKTRSMDRDVLSFSTFLQPTSTYVYGDPTQTVRTATVVPRGNMDQENGLGHIPAWFNINSEFQPQIWALVVGAVVGLIALRPGVSAVEIMRNLGWALQRQDLDMVLQFLLDCTVIESVREGWETTIWWWLALGSGQDGGEEEVGTIVVT